MSDTTKRDVADTCEMEDSEVDVPATVAMIRAGGNEALARAIEEANR